MLPTHPVLAARLESGHGAGGGPLCNPPCRRAVLPAVTARPPRAEGVHGALSLQPGCGTLFSTSLSARPFRRCRAPGSTSRGPTAPSACSPTPARAPARHQSEQVPLPCPAWDEPLGGPRLRGLCERAQAVAGAVGWAAVLARQSLLPYTRASIGMNSEQIHKIQSHGRRCLLGHLLPRASLDCIGNLLVQVWID